MWRILLPALVMVAGCQEKPEQGEITPGTVVFIKSGSVPLVVEKIEGDEATIVKWENYSSVASIPPEIQRFKVGTCTLRRSKNQNPNQN